MEIITERLIIRNLCVCDYLQFELTLNDVQKTCLGSGRAFLDFIISQYSEMDVTKNILSFGLFDKESSELLGTAGAGRHDDLGEPEIFYQLRPEFRGHGYVTEAVKALTKWVFDNYSIPYIIGTAATDNIKSQNVLERCGYIYINTQQLLVHVTNERYDFKYYRYYRQDKPDYIPKA